MWTLEFFIFCGGLAPAYRIIREKNTAAWSFIGAFVWPMFVGKWLAEKFVKGGEE